MDIIDSWSWAGHHILSLPLLLGKYLEDWELSCDPQNQPQSVILLQLDMRANYNNGDDMQSYELIAYFSVILNALWLSYFYTIKCENIRESTLQNFTESFFPHHHSESISLL